MLWPHISRSPRVRVPPPPPQHSHTPSPASPLFHHFPALCSKVDAGAAEEAQSLLVSGANTLCKHGKFAEGADLGDMLLATLEGRAAPLTQGAVDAVLAISGGFAPDAGAPLVRFLRAATKWAASAPSEEAAAGGKRGTPAAGEAARARWLESLHAATARACVAAGAEYYADAQRHFLEAAAPAEFGRFLWAWAARG
jgi:hypothetical protein